ncbi:MAG: lipoate--protein ligase [Bacteroidales bacterium]
MLYIIDTCTDPYWNLAAEEYLLKEFNEPVFRLWRNENAIIVGHYQNTIAEIDINYVKEHQIKVVRRLTGGGAVFHDLGNLNFTFIEDKIPGEDAAAMFRRFTAPILEALNSLGVKAYLEGRNDLLIDGRKFSGNAVCIHKNRILQHGTLLFSASMANLSAALKSRPEKFTGKSVQSNRSRVTNISEHLQIDPNHNMDITAFKTYLGDYICSKYPQGITPYNYSRKDLEMIGKMAEEKYALDSWNFGQSPAYSYGKVAKLTGGVVEVYLNVEKGMITRLQIFGDYFFTKPTEEFVQSLIGTPHTRQALGKKIAETDLQAYFSNISSDELIGMFF